jgi:hypothetical protein
MATKKLTLAIEPQTIEFAKDYAARHKTSVSALFSRYINALTAQEQGGDLSIPPDSVLRSVVGIASSGKAWTDEDLRYEALRGRYDLEPRQ